MPRPLTAGLLARLRLTVKKLALLVEKGKLQLALHVFVSRRDTHMQKTARLRAGVLVHNLRLRICRTFLARPDRHKRIRVANRPARKLLKTARMNRVVLPVPVATHQVKILLEKIVFG